MARRKKKDSFSCIYRGKKTGILKQSGCDCSRTIFKCFHPETIKPKNRCILLNDKNWQIKQSECYTCELRVKGKRK